MAIKTKTTKTDRAKERDAAQEKYTNETLPGYEQIIEINPTDELEKMNSYKKKIPGLEIDSDVTDFWQAQNNEVQQFYSKLNEAKNELIPTLYGEIPNIEENLISRQRNSAEQRKKYKKDLASNDERYAQAERAFQRLKREVGPLQVFLFSRLTGNDEARQKFKDAQKNITDLAKNRKEIKENEEKRIKVEKEEEDYLLYRINKAEEKVANINARVSDIIGAAEKVNANSREKQPIMQAQYNVLEIVSKKLENIKKIQSLKKNTIIVGSLQRDNRELVEQLQQVPENLPEINLKISFDNPLTLAMLENLNADKLQETGEKMEKIEKDLRKDSPAIDLTNPNKTLERYQLKEDETLKTVTDKLNDTSVQLTAEERNILEMKREYLQLQEKEKEISNSISDLIKNFDPTKPEQVQQLNDIQTSLDITRQQMEKSPYNKTVKALNEYETLKNQAQTLEQPQNLGKFETLLNGLERAGINVQSFSNGRTGELRQPEHSEQLEQPQQPEQPEQPQQPDLDDNDER